MKKPFIMLIIVMLTVLMGLQGGLAVAATTLWVNDDVAVGTNTSCLDPGYSTVTAALAAAVDGNTIEVCSGTYAESIVFGQRSIWMDSPYLVNRTGL